MYLRHTTLRKNGKTHVYWRLVRSVRHGRKVVQETVAQLGELDAQGRANAKALARSITAGASVDSQRCLFEDGAACESVPVQLGKVRLERSRAFGAVWLGWLLWRALKLDELLDRLMPAGRETVRWADVIAILAVGRLCEPSSELHVAERWYRTTALEDLLGVSAESIYDERLYRSLDRVLPHKAAIEAHLVERFGELFDLDYDLLLYDVTSTYFEGAADPELCKRGYSRDHRPDCVQVNIALVVTREGMPLGYEIFPGNTADVSTVEEIVGSMEARFGKANRVWVMDRGMVSQDNLEWLHQTGRRYVIGTPKVELKRWLRQIEDHNDWRQIREDVEVKICRGPEAEETFLLCRSASRIDKERAMHERFKARIEQGLESLARRIDKSTKRLERGAIERQIGRLLQRNSRAAGAFSITVLEDDTHPAGIRLKRNYRAEWAEWAHLTEGVYILRTNIGEWTDEALWQTYTQLTEAEAAFRVHKSELAMRPIWHHKADRIKSHILICFIAYAMWKTLQQWQSRAGLGHSPRTILEELSRITAADVVLPLADNTGRDLRIRCVVRPDSAQALLIDRLGLDLPQRLRIPRSLEM
jgi:transposase